jgi:hypothetical protein
MMNPNDKGYRSGRVKKDATELPMVQLRLQGGVYKSRAATQLWSRLGFASGSQAGVTDVPQPNQDNCYLPELLVDEHQ